MIQPRIVRGYAVLAALIGIAASPALAQTQPQLAPMGQSQAMPSHSALTTDQQAAGGMQPPGATASPRASGPAAPAGVTTTPMDVTGSTGGGGQHK